MYCLTSDGTDEGYPVPTKFFILNEKVQSLNYGTLMAEKRNDTPNWKNLFWPSWISTTGTTGISPEPGNALSPTLEPKCTPGAAK